MKKALISILAFIFSPIINAINSVHEKIIESQNDWLSVFGSALIVRYQELMNLMRIIEQRQLETNYFLGGKARTENSDEELGMMQVMSNMVQQLNHIGQKAIIPLILTAKGVIINVAQSKKLLFECSWDHIGVLQFRLLVDSVVADTFSFDLEKISLTPGFDKSEDKPVFDLARVLLKKQNHLNNGKKNISIVDHIALQATRILVTYLPQREITFHQNIDIVCYQAIISAIKPFYDNENAPKIEKEQPEEDENNEEKLEQSNVIPLNSKDRTNVSEQPEKEEQKEQ